MHEKGDLLDPRVPVPYLSLTAFNVCLAALTLPLHVPLPFSCFPLFFIQFGVFRIEIIPQ